MPLYLEQFNSTLDNSKLAFPSAAVCDVVMKTRHVSAMVEGKGLRCTDSKLKAKKAKNGRL